MANAPIALQPFVETKDLVTICIADEVLINRWFELCKVLKLPPQEISKWRNLLTNPHFRYYDLFSEIFASWLSRKRNPTVKDLCQNLRNMDCNLVAENLEAHFKDHVIRAIEINHQKQGGGNSNATNRQFYASIPEDLSPVIHGLLKPTKSFSGRESELQQLRTYFEDKESVVRICGLGGIGKTELCRRFSSEVTGGHDPFTSCVWLQGDSFEALSKSILSLSKELKISLEEDSSQSENFRHLTSAILGFSSRLLVVIDDVNFENDELTNIINTTQMVKYSRLSILITSRDSCVLQNVGIKITLDVLETKDAVVLVQKLMTGLPDNDAEKLVEILQCHPLALQQAITYIDQQKLHCYTLNYSVSSYFEEYEGKGPELIVKTLNAKANNYSSTVNRLLTIQNLTPEAVKILNVLAYLHSDDIDLNFLERICKISNMKFEDFEEGIDLLLKYSVIKMDNNSISIHRLVQQVIRHEMQNSEYPSALLDSVFSACIPSKQDKSTTPFSSKIAHLNNVCKLAWNCQTISIRYFCEFIDCIFNHGKLTNFVELYQSIENDLDLNSVTRRQLLEKLSFLSTFGFDKNSQCYSELILCMETFNFPAYRKFLNGISNTLLLKKALKFVKQNFPKNYETICEIKTFIAKANWESGDLESAVSSLEKVINSKQYKTIQSYYFLNINFLGLNLYDKLKKQHLSKIGKRVYKILNILAKNSPCTNDAVKALGEISYEKGKYEKSLVWYKILVILMKEAENKTDIYQYEFKVQELETKLNGNKSNKKKGVEGVYGKLKSISINWYARFSPTINCMFE